MMEAGIRSKSYDFSFEKNRELDFTLSCGTEISPFMEWINYFSNNAWKALGENRHKIILDYCDVTHTKTGFITKLTPGEFFSDRNPNHQQKWLELNAKLGFGKMIERKKPFPRIGTSK